MMRKIKNSIKMHGTNVLILADVIIGFWLASVFIYVFTAIAGGDVVGESNMVVAQWEFGLSIAVAVWFLWQVPFWFIKAVRKRSGSSDFTGTKDN